MSPTVLPRRAEQGLKGSHVLAVFLAVFGIVFVVNGSMIYNAVTTNAGLVANEPYRKGLHYNERIAADERQAQLHWSDGVS
ncbi:FixH family protein, partial [Acinetobacter baumannii]